MILYGSSPIARSNGDRTPGANVSLDICLDDAARIGFDGIEKGHKCSSTVEGLKAAMDPFLSALKGMGRKVIIVCESPNALHGKDGVAVNDRPRLKEAERKGVGQGIEALARQAARQGITLVYHHRMGTSVEAEWEIDRPAILREGREQGLSFLEGVRRGVFTVPGDAEGRVDFHAVLEVAAGHGSQGWRGIEAEQDPAVGHPVEHQPRGLRALKAFAKRAGLDGSA